MEHKFIAGFRQNSRLLYLPSENMLYVQTKLRDGKKEFVCYQAVLSQNKTDSQPKCWARAIVDSTNVCIRNATQHTDHDNHNIIYKELKLLKRIKKTCHKSGENLAPHKVSTKEIFYRELARYIA